VAWKRITIAGDVTVGTEAVRGSAARDHESDTDRKERIMARLDIGAVRATLRSTWRRIGGWTLLTLNHPAGGSRPR